MDSSSFKCAVLDLDGVVTDSAHVHSAAWKAMFDEYLQQRAAERGEPFREFTDQDYLEYVDGKPRYKGAKSFFDSRGITDLEMGSPDDPPEMLTICGLGNKKNALYQHFLQRDGATVFQSSVQFIKELKQRGVKVAVASSSKNTQLVLQKAGLEDLFEARVCGVVSAELGLSGKPDPDIFVVAAQRLGCLPSETLMVEDAISGVTAGKRGNFGMVLGVARHTSGEELLARGADRVVSDLSEIGVDEIFEWFAEGQHEDGWHLVYHGYEPSEEKLREVLCAVGNGYFGTRGCLEMERDSDQHYPGTYIAGVYNRIPTKIGGRDIYNNDFVNCPNWLPMSFAIGGGEFESPLGMQVLSYRTDLNLRDGVLERSMVVKDAASRVTRITSRRLASMADPHCGAIELSLTPLNYAAPVTFQVGIDGDVINNGVPRYRELAARHLEPVATGKTDAGTYLHVRTNASHVDIAVGQRVTVEVECLEVCIERQVVEQPGRIAEVLTVPLDEGETCTVTKIVGIYTSKDHGVADPVRAAKQATARERTFQGVLEASQAEWHQLWDRVRLELDGDRFIQRVARLHCYHLLGAASPHNVHIDAGMTARGLNGEAYRGHVFWDEVYILPFYNANFPEISKALLMYRYRRLNDARKYAQENGYAGAMFPWQTADGGDEETQEVHYNPKDGSWGPDLSRRQRHVSIAIYYNVQQYVQATGDREFLEQYGFEMMLDITRFWASIAQPGDDGRYHIQGVMGPDEFHEAMPGSDEPGVRDNAYTNLLVVWLMENTLRLLEELPQDLAEAVGKKVGFDPAETAKWREMTRRLNVVLDGKIISQFDGYFQLQELDWDAYREKYGNVHRMDRILKAEGSSPDDYKVAKQADTMMTYYLLPPKEVSRVLCQLGYDLGDPVEVLRANYDYYLPRTSHGSTLSKVVHAAISGGMGAPEVTWRWFLEAMESDIYDTQGGTTEEGIHCGVMAGTLDVIVRNFGGLQMSEDELAIVPNLPPHWRRLHFSALWHGVQHEVTVTPEGTVVEVHDPAGDVELRSGQTRTFERRGKRLSVFVAPTEQPGRALRTSRALSRAL
jgi:beta-phosphoglucomutase family hydrolase